MIQVPFIKFRIALLNIELFAVKLTPGISAITPLNVELLAINVPVLTRFTVENFELLLSKLQLEVAKTISDVNVLLFPRNVPPPITTVH